MRKNRLECIFSLVPKGGIIADIGTDHGFVPFQLLYENICEKVIATDISKPSLEKSRDLLKEYIYRQRAELRLGDGLKVLEPHEVDTLIIAGMGGVLISQLLEESPSITKSIKTFILQPMQGSEELRKYLWSHGFQIIHEEIAIEKNHYYEIMVVRHGFQEPSHPLFSKTLMENLSSEVDSYIIFKIKEYENILKHVHEMKDGRKKEDKIRELKENIDNCQRWLLWRKQEKFING
ncbi:MAG: class I SAM-dependent methyltransferase [Tissierellia bacterium]|nr:class I SAM-dependent methyltransferase [Tissierellia bacterium]